eukprot:2467994-Pyramimonas_sp.AAC.1
MSDEARAHLACLHASCPIPLSLSLSPSASAHALWQRDPPRSPPARPSRPHALPAACAEAESPGTSAPCSIC